MFDKIYQQHWISLDTETRDYLAGVFELQRSGAREVHDQTIISDGITNEDLRELTAEKLEAYVGSKEDFPRLWELTLAKAKSVLHPAIQLGLLKKTEEVVEQADEVKVLEEVKKEETNENQNTSGKEITTKKSK